MRAAFFLLLIMVCDNAQAQKLILGVPAYDTIQKSFIRTSQNYFPCVTARIFVDTEIVNRVHGVNYYLMITSSELQKDSLRLMDSRSADLGPINVGDSVLLTHNNAIRSGTDLVLHFGSVTTGGRSTYAIMASGTPTSLADTFICKEDTRLGFTLYSHGCGMMDMIHSGSPTACVVQEPSVMLYTGSVNKADHFLLYPTIARDVLKFDYTLNSGNSGRVMLIDGLGRTVKTMTLSPEKHNGELEVRTYPGGVYYYCYLVNGVAEQRGKVLLTN